MGVASAKAAIIDDGNLLSFEILPYTGFPQEAAAAVMEKALARTGAAADDVARLLATGFGGKAVPRADGVVPDTVCIQRAIRKLNPEVRTVINVGGHSFTVFHIDDTGALGESAITDMCTAGMGMFLETISAALEMPLGDMGGEGGLPGKAPFIDNQCPIFAESEAISLINEGYDRRDVFAAVTSSVANKIAGQARRLGVIEQVALVGGVAKNRPVVAIVQRNLGIRFADLDGIDPQIVAAYGAALLAREGCNLDSQTLSSSTAERLRKKGKA
ncbi:MAG: acyl-CoA dehydratase activase [Dehalococcoidia bacterium]|nr:acyl-CoA dehydratase activase [Dehalococcoidia bacterium]